MNLPWRVLQVADSAFPTGGFAHSAGLEAAVHAGLVRDAGDVQSYVRHHLWNTGTASLPFAAAAYDRADGTWEIDGLLDACLTNHVANRASRTQGRALLATCSRVFDDARVSELAARAASREVSAHLAVMFGAVMAALSVSREHALALYMLLALRTVASSAVRLGIVGPLEAQRIQRHHEGTLDAVLAECSQLCPAEAASTMPLLDIVGATHDRLYARLFQS